MTTWRPCGAGLDVQSRKGRAPGGSSEERPFQLPELKLLVDAVQSCKFITRRKERPAHRQAGGAHQRAGRPGSFSGRSMWTGGSRP